jgi:hypothetical protein
MDEYQLMGNSRYGWGSIVAAAMALYGTQAIAADRDRGAWFYDITSDSAILAVHGWTIESSAGLSWPDGSQAIASFWKAPDSDSVYRGTVVRCISYFSADMIETGEKCQMAVKRTK